MGLNGVANCITNCIAECYEPTKVQDQLNFRELPQNLLNE